MRIGVAATAPLGADVLEGLAATNDIAWLLTRPMVPTVIAGADRPEHIQENAAALELTLSADDLAEIDRITLVDEDRTVAPVIRRPA